MSRSFIKADMWDLIKSFIAQLIHKHEWQRISGYEIECQSCGKIIIEEQ